jgi:hypothetical protein
MPAGGVDRVQALLPAVAGASFAFAGWQSSRTVAGVDAQAAGVFVVAISLSAYLYARAFKHQGMRLQQTLDLLAGLGIKVEASTANGAVVVGSTEEQPLGKEETLDRGDQSWSVHYIDRSTQAASTLSVTIGDDAGIFDAGCLQDIDEHAAQFARMYNIDEWNVDMLAVSEAVGRPLLRTACTVMEQFDLGHVHGASRETLARFFGALECGYLDVRYHNSAHAADTLHMAQLLIGGRQGGLFGPEMVFATIVAAAGHDIGHPGTNNAYQVDVRSHISVQHNDSSCLERYHCASLFKVAKRSAACDIFANLDPACFKRVRSAVISMILHTDNAVHVALVSEFEAEEKAMLAERCAGGAASPLHLRNPQLTLNVLLHAADIGNSTKAWPLYMQWTERLFEEFWEQGEREKQRDLDRGGEGAASMEMLDVEQCCLPKCQLFFVRFFVLPLYVCPSPPPRRRVRPLSVVCVPALLHPAPCTLRTAPCTLHPVRSYSALHAAAAAAATAASRCNRCSRCYPSPALGRPTGPC